MKQGDAKRADLPAGSSSLSDLLGDQWQLLRAPLVRLMLQVNALVPPVT